MHPIARIVLGLAAGIVTVFLIDRFLWPGTLRARRHRRRRRSRRACLARPARPRRPDSRDRSALAARIGRILDVHLDALAPVERGALDAAGDMQRHAARVQQQVAQRLAGGAEGDAVERVPSADCSTQRTCASPTILANFTFVAGKAKRGCGLPCP